MALYPWSWSKVNAYLTCPRQYHEMQVLKKWKQDDDVEYLLWGNAVHKALEDNLMKREPLVGRFAFLVPLGEKLDRLPGDHYGEQKLAVDIDLKPVNYDSEFAYARCIIDRLVVNGRVAAPLDYKTGKRKPYSRQLALNSVITAANFPDLQVFHTAYIWTQGGKPTEATFQRPELADVWQSFKEDIGNMEWSYQNDAWPAKPSGLCGPNRAGTYAGCVVLDCPHNRRPDAIRRRK